MRRWLLVLLLFLMMPHNAWADARTQARKAFQDGLRRVEAGDYAGAISAFERANEILPHPDVQYNLAYACVDAGRYEDAIKWFEVYLQQPVPPADSVEIRALIEQLRSLSADPRAAVLPDGEAPSIDLEVANRDARRLEEIARALRALSPDRAKEIEAIAGRIKALPTRPAEIPAPPAPEIAPAAPAAPDKVSPALSRPAAPRDVEEYEEQDIITAATRRAATPQEAPGVVWVLTQREIRERGYETVAEALKSVAGLHVIDDQVFIDVGVRGVHGGLRGQSRIVKVLIDGHPVSFRPTSGNFLGLELIPIRAVDRIELVRGPASALYGANAFLGVLQVVTRRGGDVRGGSVAVRGGFSTGTFNELGGTSSYPSGSLDLILGTSAGGLSVLVAGSAAGLDRSGMVLPETSPLGDALGQARGFISRNDTSSPLSLFASVSYNIKRGGELRFEGGLQRLHARAEWLDYGPLSNYSRIVLDNLWARLGYDQQLGKSIGLGAFVSYSEAGPGDGHRIRAVRTGAADLDPSRHLVETFASRAMFSGVELRWDGAEGWGVRIGADFDVDHHRLQSTTTVFDTDLAARRAGDAIPAPSATQGDQTFQNWGTSLQVLARPAEWVDAIAGVRFDYHNLYEASVNGRVGSVFRLSKSLFAKALYGSSFRAPAADQLFHGAAYLGDTIGCENYAPCNAVGLQPQTAHTGEIVLGANLDRLEMQLTGYLSYVDDLIISFPNVGGFFVTTNAGSYLSKGLEFDGMLILPNLGDFSGKTHVFFSFSRTDADIPASQFDPAESIRDEFRQTELFPTVSGGAGFDVAFAPAKLGLYLEGRYVGSRRPSGSNLTLGTYDDNELPPYFELDANLSTRDLVLIGERETILSLRVTNAFNAQFVEGGFRGWDVPGRGRLIFFRVIQEL